MIQARAGRAVEDVTAVATLRRCRPEVERFGHDLLFDANIPWLHLYTDSGPSFRAQLPVARSRPIAFTA